MAKIIIYLCAFTNIFLYNYCMAQSPDSGLHPQWTESFNFEKCELADHGQNQYFILEPGYQLVLQGIDENDTVILTITVLSETEIVNNIQTRIIEEQETVNGNIIEVSRNYFAFCPDNQSVFYFGEDVDIYKNGEITGHEGAWKAGLKNAQAGLMMPGLPLLGARYYQEIAPEIAMDRAEIISLNKTIETPVATFTNCLLTEETSLLQPNNHEYKIYAQGIGLVKDGNLLLVKYGFIKK
jgi:hypothetical protein